MTRFDVADLAISQLPLAAPLAFSSPGRQHVRDVVARVDPIEDGPREPIATRNDRTPVGPGLQFKVAELVGLVTGLAAEKPREVAIAFP